MYVFYFDHFILICTRNANKFKTVKKRQNLQLWNASDLGIERE